jgi:hypothetical protein
MACSPSFFFWVALTQTIGCTYSLCVTRWVAAKGGEVMAAAVSLVVGKRDAVAAIRHIRVCHGDITLAELAALIRAGRVSL